MHRRAAQSSASMGVGRSFSRGVQLIVDFSRGSQKIIFQGGSGEISFYPLDTKKTTFFAKN